MRLKQVRVSDHSCKGAAGLQNQYHYCYGKLRRRTTDEQPFGPWYDPRRYIPAPSDSRMASAEVRVDLGSDPVYAVERLLELRRSDFTGLHTRILSINMLFYNNAYDLFCAARLVFVVNPVGGIDVQEYYNTVPADSYKTSGDMVRILLELLVGLMTVRRITIELGEIFAPANTVEEFRQSLRAYFTSMGNLVDWATNTSILVAFSYWIMIYSNRLDGIDLMADNTEAVEANDRLIALSDLWKKYSILNMCTLFFNLFTFFKIFHDHPKLGIVTATLAEGAGELLYFAIVYLILNLHYMFIGSILFGNELYEFSTLLESWNTLFLIQIGAYEFASLVEVFDGSEDVDLIVLALFFYYSFMLLVYFLLINILLGILIDAFVSVRTKNTEAQRRIDASTGSFSSNMYEMILEEVRSAFFHVKSAASKLSCGRIQAPDPAQRVWRESEWMAMIDEVVDMKRNKNDILKYGSMISLLAAMNKLPACKDEDIYYQACKHAAA